MASTVTAFLEDKIIASGDRDTVTRRLEEGYPNDQGAVIVVEDETGRVTDLDYWDAATTQPRTPGRPKMGVRAREVTLLPRHWDWLATQPGGASAALRRLVEEALRQGVDDGRARKDAAYRFMQALCGDRPGYEEALRALYKDDEQGFLASISSWPDDIRDYLIQRVTNIVEGCE